jgi:hypothetical protein
MSNSQQSLSTWHMVRVGERSHSLARFRVRLPKGTLPPLAFKTAAKVFGLLLRPLLKPLTHQYSSLLTSQFSYQE